MTRVLAVRYSSASRLLSKIPEDVQNVHRTSSTNASKSQSKAPLRHVGSAANNNPPSSSLLWDGWEDASEVPGAAERHYGSSDEEEVDLSAMDIDNYRS